MELLIIRHAQSTNNLRFATTGSDEGRSPDPDITELGERQAQALADFVAADLASASPSYPRPTHLYTSLMRRTIQTAHPLAEALDLPIVARLDTFEHPGPYDGPSHQRVAHPGSGRTALAALSARATFPEALTEDGWYTLALEDEAATRRRAAALLADLREHHADTDVVALVTHGWFGSILLQVASGGRDEVWFNHHNTATSLLAWEFWTGDGETAGRQQLGVGWVNRTDHLSPGMLSS